MDSMDRRDMLSALSGGLLATVSGCSSLGFVTDDETETATLTMLSVQNGTGSDLSVSLRVSSPDGLVLETSELIEPFVDGPDGRQIEAGASFLPEPTDTSLPLTVEVTTSALDGWEEGTISTEHDCLGVLVRFSSRDGYTIFTNESPC